MYGPWGRVFDEIALTGAGFCISRLDAQLVLSPVPGNATNYGTLKHGWGRLVELFGCSRESTRAPSAARTWTGLRPSVLRSRGTLQFGAGLLSQLAFVKEDWALQAVPLAMRASDLRGGRRWHVELAIDTQDRDRLRSVSLLLCPIGVVSARETNLKNGRLNDGESASRPVASSEELARSILAVERVRGDIDAPLRRRGLLDTPRNLWGGRPLDLARHTVITGGSGTGKSFALFDLLLNHAAPDVPIVVIDPAKPFSELAPLVSGGFDLYRPSSRAPLNLLTGPPGTDSIYEEYLLNAIDQATGLSEKFPLGRSVLNNAVGSLRGQERPTVALLVREVSRQFNAMHGSTNVADAIMSLRQRLFAVFDVDGGGLFCGGGESEIPWSDLGSGRTVVSLAGLGTTAQRRLLALCLLAGLVTQAKQDPRGAGLLIVLEEAHFFTNSAAGTSSQSTLVELLGEGLAELRSRNIGFVLCEQLPTLLPDPVLSNAGNFVAFASRDEKQAQRAVQSLGGGPAMVDTVRALPDYVAVSRFGSEPVGTLAASQWNGEPVPTTPRVTPGVGHGEAAATVSVPWCAACPAPCVAAASFRDSRTVLGSISASTRNGALSPTSVIEVALGSAQDLLGERGVPRISLADRPGKQDFNLARVATYCLVARALLDESTQSFQTVSEYRRGLAHWLRSGLQSMRGEGSV